MDASTGGKVLAKVLVFYALLNLAIECTGLAIFLAIDPGANVNLDTKVFNQTQQSETLPLRLLIITMQEYDERVDNDMISQVCHEGHCIQLGAGEYLCGTFSEVPNLTRQTCGSWKYSWACGPNCQ